MEERAEWVISSLDNTKLQSVYNIHNLCTSRRKTINRTNMPSGTKHCLSSFDPFGTVLSLLCVRE